MPEDTSSILDRIITAQELSHREHFKPQGVLVQLLEQLTERERQVLVRRFGLKGAVSETLDSIGKSFHVTRERIRQIERLAVRKITEGREVRTVLEPVRQVVVELIEEEGGVVVHERIEHTLMELGDEVGSNAVRFILAELLTDVVAPVGGDGTDLLPGWRLRVASLENLDQIIVRAADVINARSSVVSSDDLGGAMVASGLITPLGLPLQEPLIALGLLELSRQVKRNTFGDWGLSHWETITPKRMNDKIYLVLKKQGKPLHFRDITVLINEAKFDHKVAYPPTVHNELILDNRYVLVGRGIYALKEWGYTSGVVADVIADVLRQRGEPMGRDQIVAEVLTRRLVKRGTVHLALTNRSRFKRLPDGRYTLATT